MERRIDRLACAVALAALATWIAPARPAGANCNLIPSALTALGSLNGSVDRPIAGPGDRVTVSLDFACRPTAPGFSPTLANNFVRLLFQPPGSTVDPGLVTEVAVTPVAVDDCGPVRCSALSFDVPDTDALLAPPGDGRGLVGAATIIVEDAVGMQLAMIGDLYQPTLSCSDQTPNSVFEKFTVLPPPNVIPPTSTSGETVLVAMQAVVDEGGDMIVPIEYSNILPAGDAGPLARILDATWDLPAFEGDPTPIAFPDNGFQWVRAFSDVGRDIPPFLEIEGDGGALSGSVDARVSVLHIDNSDGTQVIFDLAYRLIDDRGPLIINDPVAITVGGAVPLESLTTAADTAVFVVDEAAEGTDLDGDGVLESQVVQIKNVDTGATVNTGAPVTRVSWDSINKQALANSGDVIAFLQSEASSKLDLSSATEAGDRDVIDDQLRVFLSDGSDRTPDPSVIADPRPLLNARPLQVSGPGLVFYGVREGDDQLEQTELVNVSTGGSQGNDFASFLQLSGDGQLAAFISPATNLVPGADGGYSQVYLRDRAAGTTTLLSRDAEGSPGVGNTVGLSMSASGRIVVFATEAALLPEDTNGLVDVYLLDRELSEMRMVSFNPVATPSPEFDFSYTFGDGTQLVGGFDGNLGLDNDTITGIVNLDATIDGVPMGLTGWSRVGGGGAVLSLSGAGLNIFARNGISQSSGCTNFFQFVSTSEGYSKTNCLTFDFNGTYSAARWSASQRGTGTPGNGRSDNPVVSPDGSVVSFVTNATNLFPQGAPSDGNETADDLLVYDVGEAAIVDRVADGEGSQPNGGFIGTHDLSRDGRIVVFSSRATNFAPPPGGDVGDQAVFRFDRVTRQLRRLSVTPEGADGDGNSFGSRISADASVVTFTSTSTNLGELVDDAPSATRVLLYDEATDSLEVVSRLNTGAVGVGRALGGRPSDDGSLVAFTGISDFVNRDLNEGGGDAYLYDRVTNSVDLFSLGTDDQPSSQANAALITTLSGDGSTVGWQSFASDLLPEDANGTLADVFVRGVSLAQAPDLDGNGMGGDRVLQVYDPGLGVMRPNAAVPYEVVSVAGGRAATLTKETRLADGQGRNGDEDVDDEVVILYDGLMDMRMPLAISGREVSISDEVLCAVVSETDEGTDLGGDDADDTFLFVADLSSYPPDPVNTGIPADHAMASGPYCYFTTPETYDHDLNGDGDFEDAVMRAWNVPTGQLIEILETEDQDGAPLATPERLAATDFIPAGEWVAFRVCEYDQGFRTMNRDADASDCVMHLANVATGDVTNTLRASEKCTFEGCDPFFDPYRLRVTPAPVVADPPVVTLSFVTFEATQGGERSGEGCLGTSPSPSCDLTTDGDDEDYVVQVFNPLTNRAQAIEISPETTVPPFPTTSFDGDVIILQLPCSVLALPGVECPPDDPNLVVVVGDADSDGTFDSSNTGGDNCEEYNPDQADADGDELGAACDPDTDPETMLETTTPEQELPGLVKCELTGDGVIDQTDIDIIFGDRNQRARRSDPRDADDDGRITVLDARICVNQCKNPDCAPDPPQSGGTGSCGLLGIEALLALIPWWIFRRRSR